MFQGDNIHMYGAPRRNLAAKCARSLRADQIRHRADFPLPAGHWARGDLWAAADVRRWARTYAGGEARWGSEEIRVMAQPSVQIVNGVGRLVFVGH